MCMKSISPQMGNFSCHAVVIYKRWGVKCADEGIVYLFCVSSQVVLCGVKNKLTIAMHMHLEKNLTLIQSNNVSLDDI